MSWKLWGVLRILSCYCTVNSENSECWLPITPSNYPLECDIICEKTLIKKLWFFWGYLKKTVCIFWGYVENSFLRLCGKLVFEVIRRLLFSCHKFLSFFSFLLEKSQRNLRKIFRNLEFIHFLSRFKTYLIKIQGKKLNFKALA